MKWQAAAAELGRRLIHWAADQNIPYFPYVFFFVMVEKPMLYSLIRKPLVNYLLITVIDSMFKILLSVLVYSFNSN